MAVQYFGQQTGAFDDDNGELDQLSTFRNKTFVCPGSGSVAIQELSAYVKINANTPNIRVGIYDTSYNLIAQGTGMVAVSGSSYSWQGHMTAAACGNASLTGGQSYRLAVFMDSSGGCGLRADSGHTSGDSDYRTLTDYTSGLPDPYSPQQDFTGWWNIRCGVEVPATAALTGTATASITEEDIVTGGNTIIITLTGDTFIA